MKPTPTTDREMILSPNHWSQWPFLPMKRPQDRDPSCGLVLGEPTDGDVVFFVPGANIWHIDDDYNMKHGQLIKVDDLLAEGWKVD